MHTFVQSSETKVAIAKLIKVVSLGKISPMGLIYKDTDNNNATISVSKEVLDFVIEVDSETITFISSLIGSSSEDSMARISFLSCSAPQRLLVLVDRTTHDVDVPLPPSSLPDKEPLSPDPLLLDIMLYSIKAILALLNHPEMRDVIKTDSGLPIFLKHFIEQQGAHMKLVKNENKRKAGWMHTNTACKKIQTKIDSIEEEIKVLETEVEYEKVELKEYLKVQLESVRKDLRIADKRNEEVKAKYDVVANILDASCEKVNTLVCCLCALTIWDEEGQNEVIDALNNYGRIDLVEQSKNGAGSSVLRTILLEEANKVSNPILPSLVQLITKGGHRTLWSSLHLVGCLCKTSTLTLGGFKPNPKAHENLTSSNLLPAVVEAFKSLVVEDLTPSSGGYGIGEWRHALEVLFWCLKDNPKGITIARDLDLVSFLIDLSATQLPFGDYLEEDSDNASSDTEDKTNNPSPPDETTFNLHMSYSLPPSHHQYVKDPKDPESNDYLYCSRCFVPLSLKLSLRGKFDDSENDGAVYAESVLATMARWDEDVHQDCLDATVTVGKVKDKKLGCGIIQRHVKEIRGRVVNFVWGMETFHGELISGFFEDSVSEISRGTTEEVKEADDVNMEVAEVQEEKKDPPLEDATVVQEREDDRPQAFISVLVALMEHRLDEKLYSSASAVGQLMAELALPAPYYADRHPSKVQPHAHLTIQEISEVEFEVSQAFVASGLEDVMRKGCHMLVVGTRGGKDNRDAFLKATGIDGYPLAAVMCKVIGRLCLSQEEFKDSIVEGIVKDETSANSIPGSRAGGSRAGGSRTGGSRKEGGRTGSRTASRSNTQPKSSKPPPPPNHIFQTLIETLSNGVRSFTGQTTDGLAMQHSLVETNNCDLNIKIESSGALASLCMGHGYAAQSFAEVGISALRALVSHASQRSPPELQVQACRCIYSTCVFKVVKQRLVMELKALAALLLLLHSDDPDVVIYAICAIESVVENCHPGQQFICNFKGLLPFVRITSGNWAGGGKDSYYRTANAAACKAIRVIVDRHTENRHLANSVKINCHLVQILLNGDTEEKKSAVVMFSDLLKHNNDNRDDLVSFGGVEALAVICRMGDDFLKSTSALQMKIVCANSNELTRELTKVGGVPPLVSMMNSGDTLLQRHACQTISGLVMDEVFEREVRLCGGIATIVTMLLCNDDETATYACITLGRSVAHDKESKKQAIEMGCMRVLGQIAAGSREVGKKPEGLKYMDGGELFGQTRSFEDEGAQDKMGFGFNISAARGSGLGDELCMALRCTREAAIALGNFATNEEPYILDGSSNFLDGRRVSGMLPCGLLRQAPQTHQPSSDFSKLQIEEDDNDVDDPNDESLWEEDEVTGMRVRKKKAEEKAYVPDIAMRLARRTEADRASAMTAYIERQEQLRLQLEAEKEVEKVDEDESASESEYWDSEQEDEEGGGE